MVDKKDDKLKGKTDDIAEPDCDDCDCCDDVCKDCRAKEEDEDMSNNGWGKDFIMSPVRDDEGFPLILVTTPTKSFIGAFVPTEDEGEKGLYVCSPIMFLEVMDPQQKQPGLVIRKLFLSLSIPDFLRIRYESLMFLRPSSASNRELAEMYGKEVQKHQALETGIAIPTLSDISNIRKA